MKPRPTDNVFSGKSWLKLGSQVCLLLFIAPINAAFADDSYRLNPGDIINISVWNEESLQHDVVILPDGMISFPLAGQLAAAGLTVVELETDIKEELSEFPAEPVVTVSVTEAAGNAIYVMGKVLKPGSFAMTHEMDILQALSLAGGLTPYAKENSISVIRRQQSEQIQIDVRYADLKKGVNLSDNVLLKRGDIIVVP